MSSSGGVHPIRYARHIEPGQGLQGQDLRHRKSSGLLRTRVGAERDDP